jgi:hypothetical protein
MRKIVELKIEDTKTVVGGTKVAAATTTVSTQSTSVSAKDMRAAADARIANPSVQM